MPSASLDRTVALAKNSLCIGLDMEIVAKISAQIQVTKALPGHVIFHHGDTNDDVYLLLEGTVIGQLVAESGREIVFTEMSAGTFFGELAALDGAPRSVTLSAKDEVVLGRLTGKQFTSLLTENSGLAINLATELGRRVRRMNERMFGLVVHDVGTRVRLHLMRLAQEQGKLIDNAVLEPVPTHEEIATYIGANREAVSRAITRLNRSGLIKASRKNILIKDCSGLLDGTDV